MRLETPSQAHTSRYARLIAWVRVHPWRRWLILFPLAMLLTFLLLMAVIALAYLRGSTDRDAAAVAVNMVVVAVMGTVGLVVTHRSLFPRFRREGQSAPTELPPIDWPWQLRVRHAAIYTIGMATLLYAFLPFEHQHLFGRFIHRYSAGPSSAGSLAMFAFGYLPMAILSLLAMALLHRQMKRRDALPMRR